MEVGDLGGTPQKRVIEIDPLVGDLSGVERHENLEEKFVIQFWSFSPLNVMLHVVCFLSLIITVLKKYWDGNIIKVFTLKMVRPRKKHGVSLEPVDQLQ